MPPIAKPNPALQAIANRILSGEQELDSATANQLINTVQADLEIHGSTEFEILENIFESEPKGTDYGRAIIENYVHMAKYNNLHGRGSYVKDTPDGPSRLFIDLGTQENADKARHKAVRAANYDVAGRDELRELVTQYRGAYDVETRENVMFPIKEKHIVPNDDVKTVYNEMMTKVLDEDDPMKEVREFLQDNYSKKTPFEGNTNAMVNWFNMISPWFSMFPFFR